MAVANYYGERGVEISNIKRLKDSETENRKSMHLIDNTSIINKIINIIQSNNCHSNIKLYKYTNTIFKKKCFVLVLLH